MSEFLAVLPIKGRERPMHIGSKRGCKAWIHNNVGYLWNVTKDTDALPCDIKVIRVIKTTQEPCV